MQGEMQQPDLDVVIALQSLNTHGTEIAPGSNVIGEYVQNQRFFHWRHQCVCWFNIHVTPPRSGQHWSMVGRFIPSGLPADGSEPLPSRVAQVPGREAPPSFDLPPRCAFNRTSPRNGLNWLRCTRHYLGAHAISAARSPRAIGRLSLIIQTTCCPISVSPVPALPAGSWSSGETG